MSDDDLILRGDAISASAKLYKWSVAAAEELEETIENIPAAQVTVKPPCSHINRDAQGVCWDCGYDARATPAKIKGADHG